MKLCRASVQSAKGAISPAAFCHAFVFTQLKIPASYGRIVQSTGGETLNSPNLQTSESRKDDKKQCYVPCLNRAPCGAQSLHQGEA